MPSIPAAIDQDAMLEALAALGIDTLNLHTIHVDARSRSVRLSYYAVNADGQKYLVDGAPAEVSYTVSVQSCMPAGATRSG